MDSIIGRSQFVSETANLFTDEKTATARAKVCKCSTVTAHYGTEFL